MGGIETVSLSLANHYQALGHSCTVLTRTPHDDVSEFPFKIVRNPSFGQKLKLLRTHDIVHCNGASIELVFLAKLLAKPIVWTHAGYQLISIDGLGWHKGEASPFGLWASFRFHMRKQGLSIALKEFAKLMLRQLASLLISKHVAITQWVARRQPFAGQVVIYNPFPIDRFALIDANTPLQYDFFFLGRLVSEKGVSTLLKAFALFLTSVPHYDKRLLLIGDGDWRSTLEEEAKALGIWHSVEFVGKQTGEQLLNWVAKGKIAIIPSAWEEPMGGVAIEMLAAGKPVIVSQNGGLAECVGNAGLHFPNGDHQMLAEQMKRLHEDPYLVQSLQQNAKQQITQFDQQKLTQEYLALFQKLIS